MFFIIKYLFIAGVVLIILGFLRTWQLGRSENETKFMAGYIPINMPNGLYLGSVSGLETSWQGKKFDATSKTGINIFKDASTTSEKYPFKTSVSSGVRESDVDVIKIDYDLPGNPFWLRPILDEIVMVEEGKFLGKLQLRFVPNYPFTLGFFELKK